MNQRISTVEERFVGCLLGLAIGDALGSQFEGQSPGFIARRYGTAADLEHLTQ